MRFDHRQGIGFAQAVVHAEHAGALDAFRDDAGAQRFERVEAEAVEHGLLVTGARADVTGDEFVGGAKVYLSHVGAPQASAWALIRRS